MDKQLAAEWMQKHLINTYDALLATPYILDIDPTVKPVYGKQEGAEKGYNPAKHGRPSLCYHTYFVANLRLVLDVEVQPGNQTAAKYLRPNFFKYVDRLPRDAWPAFIRGDCNFGNEGTIHDAEERGLPYLFKLRQSKNVKRLIEEAFQRDDWVPAGQDWEGVEDELRLSGWTKKRRVIVLRRELRGELALSAEAATGQLQFAFVETLEQVRKYEYAVLVTDLPDEILTLAQHYRDRADAENPFDELKNQWSWGGFTTRDLKRCQVMARHAALIYNWWSLFVRLAIPDKHAEAITSRPLLLHAVAKKTSHAGQTRVTITSTHAKAERIRQVLRNLAAFFSYLRSTAEQLNWHQRWRMILSRIFVKFLGGRLLSAPKMIENFT